MRYCSIRWGTIVIKYLSVLVNDAVLCHCDVSEGQETRKLLNCSVCPLLARRQLAQWSVCGQSHLPAERSGWRASARRPLLYEFLAGQRMKAEKPTNGSEATPIPIRPIGMCIISCGSFQLN